MFGLGLLKFEIIINYLINKNIKSSFSNLIINREQFQKLNLKLNTNKRINFQSIITVQHQQIFRNIKLSKYVHFVWRNQIKIKLHSQNQLRLCNQPKFLNPSVEPLDSNMKHVRILEKKDLVSTVIGAYLLMVSMN